VIALADVQAVAGFKYIFLLNFDANVANARSVRLEQKEV
jgi:hypothetical protein